MTKLECTKLRNWFIDSPPMRHTFPHDPNCTSDEKITWFARQKGITMSEDERRIFWIFCAFKNELDPSIVPLHYGLKTVLYDFELVLKHNVKAKSLLTPVVEEHIQKLTVYIECRHQVELFLPWIRTINNGSYAQHAFTTVPAFTRCLECSGQISEVALPEELVALARTEDGRFSYPKNTRTPREIVSAKRAAEANLDAFWDQYIPLMRQEVRLSSHINAAFDRKVHRTAEWVAPVKDAQEKTPHADDSLGRAVGGLQIGEEPPPFAATTAAKRKTKAKTRGAPKPPDEATAEVPPVPDNEVDDMEKPRIKVDKRTSSVLDVLFFVEDTPNKPGETDWSDFLHAMAAIGFAIEKCDGSAWKFTPTKVDGAKTPITFHGPHGDSTKISRTIARAMGRRLTINYGWSADSFALEG